MRRRKPPIDVKQTVLHEAGYKCANPSCRTILTLDLHHIVWVSEDGDDSSENLLPLCPNCHALHHQGVIPKESIRAWKFLLLAFNHAFDRRAIDVLLTLTSVGDLWVSGDGVLQCAPLIASNLVEVIPIGEVIPQRYIVRLTPKGRIVVEAWKSGDQRAAAAATGETLTSR